MKYTKFILNYIFSEASKHAKAVITGRVRFMTT